MSSRTPSRLVPLLAAAASTLAFAAPASAELSINVNTFGDVANASCASGSTTCNLRAAVARADGRMDDVNVYLPAGTHTVDDPIESTGPSGNGKLFVYGDTAANTIVTTSVANSVFSLETGRFRIQDLTIRGGKPTAADSAGGAIYASEASLEVVGAQLTGNSAGDKGGAIYAFDTTLDVLESTLDANTTPDATGVGGAVSVAADSTPAKVARIRNNTFTGNRASTGSAVHVEGTVNAQLTQNTFAANPNDGGAVHAEGTGAEIVMARNIVAEGSNGCDEANDGGYLVGSYNIDAGTSCAENEPTSRGDTANALGPLGVGLFGGTPAMIPQPGSPAIDFAPAAECAATKNDQRGIPRRPNDGNGDGVNACDAGAIEYETPARNFNGVTTTTTDAVVDVDVINGDAPSTVRVEYGTTTAYGSTTEAIAAPGGDLGNVKVAIAGLAPRTAYQFRIIGSDGVSSFAGPNRSFTTKAAPVVEPPAPPVVQPPPPALKAAIAKLGKLKLNRDATRKGLPVKVTCSQSCRITAQLTTTSKLGKRLGVKRRRVARVSSTGAAGKPKTLRLKIAKSVVRRARRTRKLKSLTLTVTTTPTAGGTAVTTKRKVTLTR